MTRTYRSTLAALATASIALPCVAVPTIDSSAAPQLLRRPAEERTPNLDAIFGSHRRPEGPLPAMTSYGTGFEPIEGFAPGFLEGQAGWYTWGQETFYPAIDIMNPAGGLQHLRFDRDTTLPAGAIVAAFSPNIGPQAPVPTTVTMDVAINVINNGADYYVTPQSVSEGLKTAEIILQYTGDIYVLDEIGGSLGYIDTLTDWVPGPYQPLRIEIDPGGDTIDYYYGGVLFYSSQGGVFAATTVDEIVIYSDNYNFLDQGDFDNLAIAPTLENQLTIEVLGTCLSDTEIDVLLWMRNVTTDVTGFQAFLEFDDTVLQYVGAASAYTLDPFPQHIGAISAAEYAPGLLELNGSVAFNAPAVQGTHLLAQLHFDVLQECQITSVDFDLDAAFDSHYSFEGVAVTTELVDSLDFKLDNTPPTIIYCPPDATIECDESTLVGVMDAIDNCTPSPMIVYFDDTSGLTGCNGTGDLVRLWVAIDECGNSASCVQTIIIQDTTPPDITGCPADIEVHADAGGCDAVVTWTPPTASDNCGIAFLSGSHAPGDTFPQGSTLVTYTALDACGNISTCTFTVTVLDQARLTLDVQLPGINAGGGVDRCIAVTMTDGVDCEETHVTMTLTGSPAASMMTIDVPCGPWTSMCVKDEQHTLFDTVTISIVGTEFVADATAVLLSGDSDNDSDVDIHDVTFLLYRWGLPPQDGGCPWDGTRDADFSLDGAVGSPDYIIVSANWLQLTACPCSAKTPGGSNGIVATSIDAASLPAAVAARADLNEDGVVDAEDVRIFETREGLPNLLSTRMRTGAAARPMRD